MVDGERLCDLEQPDDLEADQPLGAGLVAVHLRQPRVNGGSEAISPSMWACLKYHRTACIEVTTEALCLEVPKSLEATLADHLSCLVEVVPPTLTAVISEPVLQGRLAIGWVACE